MPDITAAELRRRISAHRLLGSETIPMYLFEAERCARALEALEREEELKGRISDLMEAMAPFANRQAEMERNRQTGETRYSHIREKQWKRALEVYTASSDALIEAARGQR